MVTYESIRNNIEINTYIEGADKSLSALGYTEHSFAHLTKVADTAEYIMKTLEFDEHTVELAKIASYMHDIGNLVNRIEHSQSGAVIAFRILDKLGMPADDIAVIVSAIGNHDEGTGVPVNPVAAALILADKTDVRRSRVRKEKRDVNDIHDRVNYSVIKSSVTIKSDKKMILLELVIDTDISSVMDYFEIFLERLILSRKAAETLGMRFALIINNQQLL